MAKPPIRKPKKKVCLFCQDKITRVDYRKEEGAYWDLLYNWDPKAVIKGVTAMIEPIMIVLMGSVVGFIAMSIILPIFKLSSPVSRPTAIPAARKAISLRSP